METIKDVLAQLGLLNVLDAGLSAHEGNAVRSMSPINGEVMAILHADTHQEAAEKISRAHRAFHVWRMVPAPRRGELVRLFGEELRTHKDALGRLVTMEAGKILQEGLGEVQEMIDICDFAVGLSRQLYGLTIASERPGHRMMETWHPLGVVGVISAFNFPVAVWSWNAALAFVCGNSVVWKPSEKTPLTAVAVQALFDRACKRFGSDAPAGLSQLLIGGSDIGQTLVDDPRVPLVSATGSTRMGRAVAQRCAQRLARSLLELGGNNAMIVAPSADLELAARAIVFSAVGTAGQRCTSLRRLFVHRQIYDSLVPRLQKIYGTLAVGNPLEPGKLIGPLIDAGAFEAMQLALDKARADGGQVSGGDRVEMAGCERGYYVRPALVEMPEQTQIMHHETFAPILYVVRYDALEQAIEWNNAVPQGLSSSIFTTDIREAELFMSATGSDCGIANVNIGPSGAEIGGAFGGEKETGGGRESGSDAWKAYMRRATNTVNYSHALPLAQGISFDI
ncbi:L-piperidine-6-carboxylate dehydrogenase [Noviherbaspirillum sp. Root189]|uniref:L-piperidine-6-carboxylate dehydrogenase n=1 Tax=Noviherbaspirillum sp. Root189 TaxID=1736487 RepID=UPI00070F584B|nr:aldehyde dehydrogenase family protein [Noviherbaspirillum sp. Root189]KRB84647.1 aldehyde dehydrogenase [Noviherbaspirillum sp. Root189]